jgi:hypothetical protein
MQAASLARLARAVAHKRRRSYALKEVQDAAEVFRGSGRLARWPDIGLKSGLGCCVIIADAPTPWGQLGLAFAMKDGQREFGLSARLHARRRSEATSVQLAAASSSGGAAVPATTGVRQSTEARIESNRSRSET